MSDMEVARNLLAGPLDDSQRRTLLRTERAAVLSDPDRTSAVVHLSSEVLVTQA
ncbi:hypothetical protein EDF31_11316 [Curtobacterium sp. PhB142]|uniref:hypothetical protein n=1 Tax=unclassified Curtobacterium TaxID=257496 RepID=UPI0010ED86E6|nr:MULTISPECIES: hypothetical protein [unclassified Curtobacterium]TCL80241.1 hypothetical protein EDF31_11316 [Curtobacterium sp. PhB142]TCL99698.1 hypothetical protein EDF26_11446 [Curtobacterium sp. PhB134]